VVPQRVNGRLTATECADLRACLDRVDPPRIWVVRFGLTGDPLDDMAPAKANLLRTRYHLLRLYLVKGLSIGLYARG
jgi:hypothetical protein